MASLTGNSVGSSYLGLLKTTDNAAIDGSLKNMTDGAGNATPLSMGTNYLQIQADTIELIEPTGGTNLMMISPTNVYFEGAVDFTNATVTGIGGGGGGGGYSIGETSETLNFIDDNGFMRFGANMTGNVYNAFIDTYDPAQQVQWVPFSFKSGDTLDKLGLFVAQMTTAGGVFQIGVYDSDGTHSMPQTRIYNSGDIVVNSTGFKFLTGLNITTGSSGVADLLWIALYQKTSTDYRLGKSSQGSSRIDTSLFQYDRLIVSPGYSNITSWKENVSFTDLPATYTAPTTLTTADGLYSAMIG